MTARSSRSDGAARRELLLEAGVALAAERGVAALTHRAIAQAAAVPVASASYHFPSIDEFRLACFQRAGDRIGGALAEAIALAEGRTADVPQICGAFAASLVGERRVDAIAILQMLATAAYDARLRPLVESFESALGVLLSDYVGSAAAGRELGEALQGLLFAQLARGGGSGELQESVRRLIERSRRSEGGTERTPTAEPEPLTEDV